MKEGNWKRTEKRERNIEEDMMKSGWSEGKKISTELGKAKRSKTYLNLSQDFCNGAIRGYCDGRAYWLK